MSKDLVPEGLDPVLEGVRKTFRLEEEFKIFLDRNEHLRASRPDVGFLLFLIEQQREAIINLELRVAKLETGRTQYREPYSSQVQRAPDSHYIEGRE